MNKRHFIIFLIIINYSSIAQIKVDSLRYKYALKAPKTDNVKYLARFLRAGATNSNEKAIETFFYWITQNISYDFELMRKEGISENDISVITTLETKKTICAGYAKLLFELCNAVKIECVIIPGISQNFFGNNSLGHDWNAVKINDKWLLVDSTWGSGGSIFSSDEFIKELDMRYLFADPNFFIIDHLPDEEDWQLLEKPISREVFIGKEWQEKRMRKFNNLLNDKEYANYTEKLKNAEKETDNRKED